MSVKALNSSALFKQRSLVVWCNNDRVDHLVELNDLWSFEYDPEWNGFDLSPFILRSEGIISDGASSRPVQWFFDNLLPEEQARTLLAKDARIDEADAFPTIRTRSLTNTR